MQKGQKHILSSIDPYKNTLKEIKNIQVLGVSKFSSPTLTNDSLSAKIVVPLGPGLGRGNLLKTRSLYKQRREVIDVDEKMLACIILVDIIAATENKMLERTCRTP